MNVRIKLQSWGHCVSNGKTCVCVFFLYSPYFLSPIPRFDRVTGPGVYRAGVETGLAEYSGYTPFSIPPGGLCYPFPMLLIAPQGGLYPWIAIHPCSAAPLWPVWLHTAAKPGLLWGGKQQSWARGPPVGSSAGAELKSQVVWIDRW